MFSFIKGAVIGAIVLVVAYYAIKFYAFLILKLKKSQRVNFIIKWPLIIILSLLILLMMLYGGMITWTIFEGVWEAIQ